MQPAVIIVDDEPAIVELVCDVLNDAEIPTESCPDGHRAHACIRHKQPRVAILDIQMPQVDGIELFQLLRADPSTQEIRVIFLTANAQRLEKWLPNYKALGADLISKPFRFQQLLNRVEQLLAS